jgi:hypothetical protein
VPEHRGIRQEGQHRGLRTATGLWGDAWKKNPAGGDARGIAPAVSGGGGSRAEGKRG